MAAITDAGAKALWKVLRENADAAARTPAIETLLASGYWMGFAAAAEAGLPLPAPTEGLLPRHHPDTPTGVRAKLEAAALSAWNSSSAVAGKQWAVSGDGSLQLADAPVTPLAATAAAAAAASSTAAASPSAARVALPRLILTCGYPGSGKSTWAEAVASTHGCVRVNKDSMRGKGEVLEAANAAMRAHKTVIVDNCNLTVAHRHEWLAWLADKSPSDKRAWCVFFGLDVGECRERIVRRKGHPTLVTPEDGLRALGSLEGTLVPPTAEEGFERVDALLDDNDANALLEELGCAPIPEAETTGADAGLFKFPRTPHIANLGAATRGDKLLSASDVALLIGAGHEVFASEKVDGAQIGFSIGYDGRVVVQNRGHVVDSAYHPQFKPLDKWIAKHMSDLWQVLQADEYPGRFILFGEWLYARHSVPYASLPDLFLAFDLYDREEGAFVAFDAMVERLTPTTIHPVPLLHRGPIKGMEGLKALVTGKSAYGDGPREGVVVKLCRDGKVALRGKLVNAGFLEGLAAGRWNRGGVVPNTLTHEAASGGAAAASGGAGAAATGGASSASSSGRGKA